MAFGEYSWPSPCPQYDTSEDPRRNASPRSDASFSSYTPCYFYDFRIDELKFLVVSLILHNFFLVLVTFLVFALLLSLSVVSATFVTSIVETLVLSAIVLRILENLLGSVVSTRLNSSFCMEISVVLLLVCSSALEIISIGFRSFSLGFRLFANVSAGHMLGDIILVLRYSQCTNLASWIVQFTFSYFLLFYETIVATIQTCVFVSLISVYAE